MLNFNGLDFISFLQRYYLNLKIKCIFVPTEQRGTPQLNILSIRSFVIIPRAIALLLKFFPLNLLRKEE